MTNVPPLPSNATSIADLLKGTERYNPTHISKLEDYVRAQVKDGTYDFEANLTLLKLYQFNPTKVNLDVTAQVLLKMLLVLPTLDFANSLFLASEHVLADSNIKKIVNIAQLLESTQFAKFWQLYNANPQLERLVPSFAADIRKFISHVISISAQSIDVELLAQLLNLSANELNGYVASQGWSLEHQTVSIGANKDNQVKTKNISEKIQFSSFTKLLAHTAI